MVNLYHSTERLCKPRDQEIINMRRPLPQSNPSKAKHDRGRERGGGGEIGGGGDILSRWRMRRKIDDTDRNKFSNTRPSSKPSSHRVSLDIIYKSNILFFNENSL